MIADVITDVINAIPVPEYDGMTLKDGLYYCAKCNTPKQAKISIFGTEKTVWVMCDCEAQHEADEKLKFRTNMTNEEIERSRQVAMLNPDFKDHTFANDHGRQPMMKNCRKYANDFRKHLEAGRGLLLYGSCGTGKTYAAEAIANKVIDQNYPVLVTNFGKIAEAVGTCNFDERAAYYSSLSKYPLLIIDDLGRERETEFMMEIIQRVIDERDRSGKPMIISTNFGNDDFKNPRTDAWARVFSRIFRTCYPIKFDGADNRKADALDNFKEMKKYFEDTDS